jgi:hypothetical protein
MHGNSVEVITGRANSPVEYHCGCGNYAVVGKPARWPFMEITKDTTPPEEKKAGETFAAAFCPGSSPIQVGESVVKSSADYSRNIAELAQRAIIAEKKTAEKCKSKQEEPIMSRNPQCKSEGCTKIGAFIGLCATHFKTEYGITYRKYMKCRHLKGEDPREVAKRIRADNMLTVEKKEKPVSKKVSTPRPEEVGDKKPAPPPVPPTITKEDETVLLQLYSEGPFLVIVLPPEIKTALAEKAKAEYRSPEQHAAYLIHTALKEG